MMDAAVVTARPLTFCCRDVSLMSSQAIHFRHGLFIRPMLLSRRTDGELEAQQLQRLGDSLTSEADVQVKEPDQKL